MRNRIAFIRRLAASGLFVLAAAPVAAEEIGEVTTAIKILGANHRITIEAFDDPKVEGVACYISRARTGGIAGSLGLAEDTSDASIDCAQTGPVKFREELKDGEEVFSAGDVMLLPPGHDAWTVGEEACTFVEFSRGNDYYTG